MSPAAVRLVLPLPPSANRYWRSVLTRTGYRVLKSREARAYRDSAEFAAIAQMRGRRTIGRYVAVSGTFYFERDNRDLDNAVKVLLDSLQGVCYADDKAVRRLGPFEWALDRDNPRVEVTVEPIEEAT